MVNLIFCAGKSITNAATAIRYGFKYGAQLPNRVHFAPDFADQDWRNPDRDAYMTALAEHRPALATVLDFERADQFDEVLAWAREAAQYVTEAVIIIPKVIGDIDRIPYSVNGKPVRLGFSVPTEFAGTSVPAWEFGRREVHLLGGSPHEQHRLAKLMNVKSADGNYILKQAGSNRFFSAGRLMKAKNRRFPMLRESVFGDVKQDTPYLAFELSCMNIQAMWAGCQAMVRFAVSADIPSIEKIARQYRNELGYVRRVSLVESMTLRRNLVVAEYNGQVVGFVNYRACKAYPNSENPDRRIAWSTVYEIAVDRARKGEHIGAGLLAAVPNPIRLKCTTDNPANTFYERMGFTCTGTEDGRKRRLNRWEKRA